MSEHIAGAREYLMALGIRDPDGWIVGHVPREKQVDAKYYKNARAEIGRRIGQRTVCWVSDDVEWVYKNLYEQGDIVCLAELITRNIAIISVFRHCILSSDTNSSWAARLNPYAYESKTRAICYPHQDTLVCDPEWVRIETTAGNAPAQVSNHA